MSENEGAKISNGALDYLPPLRDVIAAHGLNAKKSLGQNFLLDLNLTRKIARAAGPFHDWAYEVGPGPGGLTRSLLSEGAKVLAVERDERCLTALAEIVDASGERLSVISANAMDVDEVELLTQQGATLPVPVAANLPYNVGTALLIKWLTAKVWPPFWSSLTLMFQREVAERICAKPHSESYGRLSVLTQWRSTAKILFDVSPRAFVPPPSVTSSIVRVEPLAQPRYEAELADLEAVTAAGFGQRRKMLRGSLKQLTDDTGLLLEGARLAGTERAEELDLEQFCALARSLRALRNA